MPCFLDLAFLLLNLFQFLLLFIHSTHNRSGSSVFYLPSKLSALFLYSMRYRLSSYVIQFFQIFSLTFYLFYALCTWQSCNLIFFTFSFNYLPNLINTDLAILLFDLNFFFTICSFYALQIYQFCCSTIFKYFSQHLFILKNTDLAVMLFNLYLNSTIYLFYSLQT